MDKLTEKEVYVKMITLLKRENEKMASLLEDKYTPTQEDLDEMYFLDKLAKNPYIKWK